MPASEPAGLDTHDTPIIPRACASHNAGLTAVFARMQAKLTGHSLLRRETEHACC
jgi:hypothetical protein